MPREAIAKTNFKNRLAKEVFFEFYAPQAKKVGLGGTFNGWDASKCNLSKQFNGKWTVTLKLQSGRYEYRYWVDGNWENDQRSTIKCVPNAFGTWNCVLEIS